MKDCDWKELAVGDRVIYIEDPITNPVLKRGIVTRVSADECSIDGKPWFHGSRIMKYPGNPVTVKEQKEKKIYTIPVRFTGKIEYAIIAGSEEEAKLLAERHAVDEAEFDRLEDISYEVKDPVAVRERSI